MNNPITPKAMSPPITPAKIRSSGRSAPRLISIGRTTFRKPRRKSPTQEARTPQGAAPRIDEDYRGDEDGPGADLRDRQDEHHRGQERRERHAGNREPDPGKDGLKNSRHHDTERDAAYRLCRQMHRLSPAGPASLFATVKIPRAAVSPFG